MVKEVVSRSTAAMREGSNPSSPKEPHSIVVSTWDFELANKICSYRNPGARVRFSVGLKRGCISSSFNEDVRVVKETGLRSVDESRVGSTPTPRIF